MLHRKAQSLPQIWHWPVPRRPRKRLSDHEWNVIMAFLLIALIAEIVALATIAAVVVWPMISARLALAPEIAAPIAQPAAPIAVGVPIVAPIPAAPVIAPAIAHAPKTIPLAQVSWEIVPGAPVVQALFVKNGILYGVQNTPGGYITWRREDAGGWTKREATAGEAALVPTRDWHDERETIIEILGEPLDGHQPWSVVKSDNTLGLCRDPLPPETKSFSRLFLKLKAEGGWIEISAPQPLCVYGFAAIDDNLFVADNGRLWQAKPKSP